ncbi:MAG: CHASE2 domain-containing protein [Verrucomicrobiales bacterium]|nr:CHASE2 domain-containing protein [Verrucomicrobiales bacterium]
MTGQNLLKIHVLNTIVSGKLLRLYAIGLALTVSAAGLVLHSLGVTAGGERYAGGVIARLLPKKNPAAPPVALVTIRDLGKQGWPWPNLDYAVFLSAIAEFKPAVVALAVPLEAGVADYQIYDAQLAKQLHRFERVTLLPGAPAAIAAAAKSAPAPLLPDADGEVRRVPLIVSAGGQVIPAFVLQTYLQYLGADWQKSIVTAGAIVLRDAAGRDLARIPVDRDGCLRLHGAGQVQAAEFYQLVISAEQLRNNLAPILDPAIVSGKILLVGAEAAGAFQPVNRGGPAPVRLLYQALNDLFAADFTRPVSDEWLLAALLLTTLTASQLALLKNPGVSAALALLMLCVIVTVSVWLLTERQLSAPIVTLSVGIVLTWALAVAFKTLAQSRQAAKN